jgi:hypothetical protein
MRFMNAYDIEHAARHYAAHPVLGPATKTLENLCDWANQNSDGWAYWPKPARAARKLMELVEGEAAIWLTRRDDATAADYRKALAPVKAFRTKQKADFEIVEVK